MVLRAKRRHRNREEPTGAAESLRGVGQLSFGDRVETSRRKKQDDDNDDDAKQNALGRDDIDKRIRDRKGKRDEQETLARSLLRSVGKKRKNLSSVLSLHAAGTYSPQTPQCRDAHDRLLSLLSKVLDDPPHDALRLAGDVVLGVLKQSTLADPQRRHAIQRKLSLGAPLSDDCFFEFARLGKLITDFASDASSAPPSSSLSSSSSTKVMTINPDDVDSSDEDEQYDRFVHDSESESDDDDKSSSSDEEDDAIAADNELDVPAAKIDGAWLSAMLARFFDDEIERARVEGKVLDVLRGDDVHGMENRLVALLGGMSRPKMHAVKVLLHNRAKVVCCTLLARAASETERAALEAKMDANAELRAVLAELASGGRSSSSPPSSSSRRRAQMLDLDALAFEQGGMLMSNSECKMPESSFRARHRKYEEVFVPAKRAAVAPDERLVQFDAMPPWARLPFAHLRSLNRVQSAVFGAAFREHHNLLVCAPTGSGKTVVALLAILHELGLNRVPPADGGDDDGTSLDFDLSAFKIVYVAPMKALVQEVVLNFAKRLAPYGVRVAELSGDHSLSKREVAATQIIVTTPEKWDVVTRKSGDRVFLKHVRLIIFDEIHLLHNDRGPVLESIVARTIRTVERTQAMIRLMGLSATLPGYEDVATFLRVDADRGLFVFSNEHRPVPLQQKFVGITERNSFKRIQLMNELAYRHTMASALDDDVDGNNDDDVDDDDDDDDKQRVGGGGQQVLVFVHSRKETVRTARVLRAMAERDGKLDALLAGRDGSRAILRREAAENASGDALRELMTAGFGVHHAGMSRGDRELVEALFHDGHLRVLCSTATLAWGVNLPAHTVIIKGTQVYDAERSEWIEIGGLDVMQMIGRAGRPGFDVEGEGIIMTTRGQLQYYLSLINHQLPVESQMLARLPDMLNAEVALGTVSSVADAVEWLGYTYLYICMLRNPPLYGITHDEADADRLLEARRRDLAHTSATVLARAGLVRYDRRSGALHSTELGSVASHFYVSHDSIALYMDNLRADTDLIDLLRVFALSSEFQRLRTRPEERVELEQLLQRAPVPIKDDVDQPAAKANALLQAYIGRIELDANALGADMVYITQSAGRICRALLAIAMQRGWARTAQRALMLSQAVERRMWPVHSPLRQFLADNDVGRGDNGDVAPLAHDLIRRLEAKDISWERYYHLNSQQLGSLVNRPEAGRLLHRYVHLFPRLDLAVHVQPISRSTINVELEIGADFEWLPRLHGRSLGFYVMVEDADGDVILHHDYFVLKQKLAERDHFMAFTVPVTEPRPPHYFVRVVSDRWMGAESVACVSLRRLALPALFAPPTELIDQAPRAVAGSLRSISFARHLESTLASASSAGGGALFNPMQTQCFDALYNDDRSALVCAPSNSGKTLLAELAVLRLFEAAASKKPSPPPMAVCLTPLAEQADALLAQWRAKFGQLLGLRVAALGGDASLDAALLDDTGDSRVDVVIASAARWDVVSRRWRQLGAMERVRLLVVDELHMIGNAAHGHSIEMAVSRMRYICASLEQPMRIVGLSASLADARDLGAWLGVADDADVFNFRPHTRLVPLDVHVHGFDQPFFEARQLAMHRPTLHAVRRCTDSTTRPVIVFAPSRREAGALARDLLADERSRSSSSSKSLLHCSDAELAPFVDALSSVHMQELLRAGIALYHETLDADELRAIEHVFAAGAVQVLVATRDMCWRMTAQTNAHTVVVAGAQYYCGKEHRYVDYGIAELLAMLARAGRANVDGSAAATVLCAASRRRFYEKYVHEPLPIESSFDAHLADHLNAEVAAQSVEDKQDALDYLSWSFFFRRLTKNANYYGLRSVAPRDIAHHLSELVETALSELADYRCVAIDNDVELSPLNLGMVASYYGIECATVELFGTSITSSAGLRSLLHIVASAGEFDTLLPMRRREPSQLRSLARHLPVKVTGNCDSIESKTCVLLQAHFSRRRQLSPSMAHDLQRALPVALQLTRALVDVISSHGWLRPAIAAMELSQQLVQAMWVTDSPLLQLPHFSVELARRAADQFGVEGALDILDLEDDDRVSLFADLDAAQLEAVANACNRFPNVEVRHRLVDADQDVAASSPITLSVDLEREVDEDSDNDNDDDDDQFELSPVCAPFFPSTLREHWWLVAAQGTSLLGVKRIFVGKRASINMVFPAPDTLGKHQLTLFLICDSYLGADQEFEFELHVDREAEDDSGSE
jgi:pre-mRNA-splicing helicase BRR2